MSGERGPKPMPPNLRLLTGNAGKKPLATLLDEAVRPEVEIPECPPHLEGEAQAEWFRITPHLYKLGLIAQIDRAALALYCGAWGEYVWACERIEYVKRRAKLHIVNNDEDDGEEAGRVSTTPSGYQQISVVMQIRNRAADQTHRYLASFGLSPADRTRVTQSDSQIPLPGMETPKAGGWANYQ